jgi:competence ComEA-like helix-hairpin-helix protein
MKQICLLILLTLPLWAGAQDTPPPQGSSLLPPGSGKPIVQRKCVACHSLNVVTAERGSSVHWAQVVNQMVGRGANLSDPEIDTIVKYLATHFGSVGPETPSATPSASTTGRVNVNTASAQELESSLGLNQKTAEALVEYRKKNGQFKTWQDVAAVPEASPNQIEALQDRLAF